jgi:hypothetical protein
MSESIKPALVDSKCGSISTPWWKEPNSLTFWSKSSTPEQCSLSPITSTPAGSELIITSQLCARFQLKRIDGVFACIEAVVQLYKYLYGRDNQRVDKGPFGEMRRKRLEEFWIKQFSKDGVYSSGCSARRAGTKEHMLGHNWKIDRHCWSDELKLRVMEMAITARAYADAAYREKLMLAHNNKFQWRCLEMFVPRCEMFWGGRYITCDDEMEWHGPNHLGILMAKVAQAIASPTSIATSPASSASAQATTESASVCAPSSDEEEGQEEQESESSDS